MCDIVAGINYKEIDQINVEEIDQINVEEIDQINVEESGKETGQTISGKGTGQTISGKGTGQTISGQTISGQTISGQTISCKGTGQTISCKGLGKELIEIANEAIIKGDKKIIKRLYSCEEIYSLKIDYSKMDGDYFLTFCNNKMLKHALQNGLIISSNYMLHAIKNKHMTTLLPLIITHLEKKLDEKKDTETCVRHITEYNFDMLLTNKRNNARLYMYALEKEDIPKIIKCLNNGVKINLIKELPIYYIDAIYDFLFENNCDPTYLYEYACCRENIINMDRCLKAGADVNSIIKKNRKNIDTVFKFLFNNDCDMNYLMNYAILNKNIEQVKLCLTKYKNIEYKHISDLSIIFNTNYFDILMEYNCNPTKIFKFLIEKHGIDYGKITKCLNNGADINILHECDVKNIDATFIDFIEKNKCNTEYLLKCAIVSNNIEKIKNYKNNNNVKGLYFLTNNVTILKIFNVESIDVNLKKNNYDLIIKLYGFNIINRKLSLNLPETCCICYDSANIETSCKHNYCSECFITNLYVTNHNQCKCAVCTLLYTKNITVLN